MKAAQAEAAEANPVRGVTSARSAFKPNIMSAFKAVDMNKEKFVKKVELRKKLDTLVGELEDVKELVTKLRGVKDVIIEQKDFEKLVDEWVDEAMLSRMR